jgi:hypothetical protein
MRAWGFVLAVLGTAVAILPSIRGGDEKKMPADTDAITQVVKNLLRERCSDGLKTTLTVTMHVHAREFAMHR